jgi:hypothetical protein
MEFKTETQGRGFDQSQPNAADAWGMAATDDCVKE